MRLTWSLGLLLVILLQAASLAACTSEPTATPEPTAAPTPTYTYISANSHAHADSGADSHSHADADSHPTRLGQRRVASHLRGEDRRRRRLLGLEL